ncbi:hypothetical protein [Streptomyces sp. NPDC047061]|uniref:hypothetical protein n=1 Tax=Streptomyces sp. NPDC047061 TaxID=3154605 RepID=UPI00340AF614
MHTNQLTPDMFEVRHDGAVGGMDSIFPDWDRHDRFGIVIHEAWGAIGASLLIQGAVSEFFRARRAAGIKDIYPEIYAIHVGRDFGDLSMYDFWPHNKETVVENNPAKVLQAINDRAITRLAVPAGERKRYDLIWPEVIAVKDRVRTVIAYDASGRTPEADIEIHATSDKVEPNTVQSLDILTPIQEYKDSELPDQRRWIGYVNARLTAVTPEETQRALEAHRANLKDGLPIETFLKADVKYALDRLVA